MNIYIKKITLFLSLLILTSCNSIKSPEQIHERWFPNSEYLKSIDTSTLELEANKSNAEAKLKLAIRMMNGDRTEVNKESAFKIFNTLASVNDPRAEFFLGAAYHQGAGVDKNEVQASYWYQRSALGGYNQGQYWHGYMLSKGYGYDNPNWSEAVKWFRKAAHQGHPDAQASLGYAYEQCKGGLNRNFKAAAKWYRIASLNNSMLARFNLRRLIEIGVVEWKNGDNGKPPENIISFDRSFFSVCSPNSKDNLENYLPNEL